MDKCPKCNTILNMATGIGPYCPNKDCNVVDNINNWQTPLEVYTLETLEDIVFKYIDRINDPTEDDPLEKSASEFVKEVNTLLNSKG